VINFYKVVQIHTVVANFLYMYAKKSIISHIKDLSHTIEIAISLVDNTSLLHNIRSVNAIYPWIIRYPGHLLSDKSWIVLAYDTR